MSAPYLIALAGFDSFENTTFGSFFRLATRREPGFAVSTEISTAAMLIVNGDNAEVFAASLRARKPGQPVLVIGRTQPAAAAGMAFLARPIRFMVVLGQVESMLGLTAASSAPAVPVARFSPAAQAVQPPSMAKAQPVDFAATRPMTAADRAAAMRPASTPDFEATQPFMPMGRDAPQPYPAARAAASASPRSSTTRATDFAATQPFAPLEMADSQRDTGFEATQPFAPLQAGAAMAPIVIPTPARRDEMITMESLAAYKRAPADTGGAAGASTRAAPQVLPLVPQSQRPSDPDSTGSFMGLGTSSMTVAPEAMIDDVMVVDDSDVALKFMHNRLGRLGFRVTSVRSGEEALVELPLRHYRYIFLDVMMGDGMDGFQTCRAIKKAPLTMGTKPLVFILSSRGGVFDKMRGSLAGADAYLIKPLNELDLNKVLSKHEAASGAIFAATREAHSRTLGDSRSSGRSKG